MIFLTLRSWHTQISNEPTWDLNSYIFSFLWKWQVLEYLDLLVWTICSGCDSFRWCWMLDQYALLADRMFFGWLLFYSRMMRTIFSNKDFIGFGLSMGCDSLSFARKMQGNFAGLSGGLRGCWTSHTSMSLVESSKTCRGWYKPCGWRNGSLYQFLWRVWEWMCLPILLDFHLMALGTS